VIGDGVGTGARYLAKEETPPAALGFQFAFLLVVDVEDVDRAGTGGEGLAPAMEQATHDRRAEGIEEEDEQRAFGEWKLDCIAFDDLKG